MELILNGINENHFDFLAVIETFVNADPGVI